MRVVSLLPSATEMVGFAGATESLVGVSHECDYPPGVERLPRLTASKVTSGLSSREIDEAVRNLSDEESLYSLDAHLLEELRPDLIVTQGLCEVCAVSVGLVERAARALDRPPKVLSLNPTSLEDVLNDCVRVGEAVGSGDETRRKVGALRERLARAREAVRNLPRPRVGCLEWLDPPFSAGHWVPEMVRLAGGEDVFARPGDASRRMTPEEVVEAAPDALVLMPCGFGVERALEEVPAFLANLPGRSGAVWVVDANSHFSRPAPRLVEGVEVLARILHPEVFGGVLDPGEARRLSGRFLRKVSARLPSQ